MEGNPVRKQYFYYISFNAVRKDRCIMKAE